MRIPFCMMGYCIMKAKKSQLLLHRKFFCFPCLTLTRGYDIMTLISEQAVNGKLMTLSKLARLANVSVSVVSKAFSGKDDISDAMREHVFSVAREHGCFQQFYHVPYDKPVIAVIIPEAISKHYIGYIETLKADMEKNGYTMLLSINNFDPVLNDELVRYYTMHGRVDGLIVMGSLNALPDRCTTAAISIASEIGETSERGCYLAHDLRTGIVDALRYLKQLGHTSVGYIGEPLTRSKCERLAEEAATMGFEIKKEWMITSRLRFEEAGKDGIQKLLALSHRPTAIFSAYGYITQGIFSELSRQGLRVPKDLSVISMTDDPSPLSDTLDVSRIPSDIEGICEAAMRLLQERIRTENPNTLCRVLIPTVFEVGDTVGAVMTK